MDLCHLHLHVCLLHVAHFTLLHICNIVVSSLHPARRLIDLTEKHSWVRLLRALRQFSGIADPKITFTLLAADTFCSDDGNPEPNKVLFQTGGLCEPPSPKGLS